MIRVVGISLCVVLCFVLSFAFEDDHDHGHSHDDHYGTYKMNLKKGKKESFP